MDLIWGAFYTNSGSGATGLTVTIDVVSINRVTGAEAVVATGASMTEATNIDGLYTYRQAGADTATYTYFAAATTAGTVDQADLPATVMFVEADAVQISGSGTAADNVEANIGNLDAAVSSRSDFDEAANTVTLADGSLTAAKFGVGAVDANAVAADAVTEIQAGLATAAALATVDSNVDAVKAVTDNLNDPALADIVDAMLDELLSNHVQAGSVGKALGDVLEDTATSLPALIGALENLSAAQVNAEMVDVVGTDAVEGTLTHRDILRLVLAFIAGPTTGGNTTSITFKSQDEGTDRIVMTVDSDGDRSVITVDGS